MKENECLGIKEIQNLVIKNAIIWANEINLGNNKKANKQNSQINKIILKIKKDKVFSRNVLVPLLQNSEPSVRLFASVHSLDQGFEVQKALQILEDLTIDYSTQGISIMAYINLKKWKSENKST